MKRILFAVLVALVALPLFAAEPAAAPAAEPAAAPAVAPAADPAAASAAAPAVAPAADPAAASAAVKLEGKVVVVKDKGQPDVVSFKTADAELTLLPCDKLTELLKAEGFADKTYVLEGEKVAAKDGKTEGFMIKSFEEKKADAPAAPATEGK